MNIVTLALFMGDVFTAHLSEYLFAVSGSSLRLGLTLVLEYGGRDVPTGLTGVQHVESFAMCWPMSSFQ